MLSMCQKVKWLKTFQTRAFTLLESLLVLFLVSLLALSLSGAVSRTFAKVEENLFFTGFEQLYLDSQRFSSSQQTPVQLKVTGQEVSNGYQLLQLPKTVQVQENKTIEFSADGGNSSLTKLVFRTQTESIAYQLYIGSGKYKKTITSLYSP